MKAKRITTNGVLTVDISSSLNVPGFRPEYHETAPTLRQIPGKGGLLHRYSGNIFTMAMLTPVSSALWLAILKSQRSNIIGIVEYLD